MSTPVHNEALPRWTRCAGLVLGIGLIMGYCLVPIFTGHGVGFLGWVIGLPELPNILAWTGFVAALYGPFQRLWLIRFSAPVLLTAAVVLWFAAIYGGEPFEVEHIETWVWAAPYAIALTLWSAFTFPLLIWWNLRERARKPTYLPFEAALQAERK